MKALVRESFIVQYSQGEEWSCHRKSRCVCVFHRAQSQGKMWGCHNESPYVCVFHLVAESG